MSANRIPGAEGRRNTCLLVAISLSVAGVVMMPGFAARKDRILEHVHQQPNKLSFSVQDARPVAKAIGMFEAKYGWVITYEDPRYVYPDDIADVTEKVRRDLQKYRAGAAPKVLVPRERTLSFNLDISSPTNLPPDPRAVVQQVLDAQAVTANFSRFRIEKGDKIIHVIPTAVRSKSGKLSPQQSILETVVTLPPKERTGLQTLEALCAEISQATQTRVVVGPVPLRLFLQHKDEEGMVPLTARKALVQLFERVTTAIKLSWQLFYDPGLQMYVLNIHVV